MKKLLWIAFFLLPSCAKAEREPCDSLTTTAIGAALGDSTDAYNLGVEFYTGKCIERDYESAATMWEKAASSGVISAKNNLGYLLSRGLGVKEDESRAAALWREAALAGHAESQLHLGVATFHGNGVPQDKVDGLAWVILSADSAIRDTENGGGPEVSTMVGTERTKLLTDAPTLLPAAEARAQQLAALLHKN